MALNLVGQFYIHPSLSLGLASPFSDNRTVKIYWDDVTSAFRVFLYDTSGVELAEALSGPTISVTSQTRALHLYTKKFSFCDGTTFNKFYPDNKAGNDYSQLTGENVNPSVLLVFPYGKQEIINNHWSCDVHICDTEFDLTYTQVTQDSGASDGTVSVKATTNATTIRFTRDPNATYNEATPSVAGEYTFTGLAAGTYTIYAIDEFNCKSSIIVIIPSAEAVYATRWCLQYFDLHNRMTRVDIEEKDYAGSITYVKGGSNPFVLAWSNLGETNIFTRIFGSVATISLISETDFMFLDLFTQDERKFRVKQYKDVGAGLVLKWIGFVLPMAYSEPYYIDRNYEVQITANDQIGNLKDIDFSDDSGNKFTGSMSFLDAICAILRKTDILNDLRDSVNIFELTMQDDAEDSSIQQGYFDASIYFKNNCEDVLVSLMTTFGARVYQAEGYWNVELIEQRSSSSIAHRIFTLYGVYSSNSTANPVSNIKAATESTRSVLRDRSGLISVIPSFGKILFTLFTNSTNNMLRSGTFEPTDLINNQIVGWSFDMTSATGVVYGIEVLDKPIKESTTALFIDFTNVTTEKEIILLAEQFELIAINGATLVFRFDVLFRPYYKDFFSYLDYSLKIGDSWVSVGSGSYFPLSDTTQLIDGEYNRVYVDNALEWKTIETKIKSSQRYFNTELEGPVILKIRIDNNPRYDFASIAALKALVTDGNYVRSQFNRVKVLDGTNLRIYILNHGTNSESSPDVIRPNDYHGTTNTQVWKLEKTLAVPTEEYLLAGVLIDNVVLTLDNSAYPNEILIEKTINDDIKQPFELDLYHADVNASEIASLEVDENSKRVFKSFIRLNDGSETTLWKRTYEDEQRTIVDILFQMYQGQITAPAFKLSGSFFSDVYPSMFNSFYESRLQKYFIANSLAIHDKSCSFDAELIEKKSGTGGLPIPDEVYEFTDEHSTEFDA